MDNTVQIMVDPDDLKNVMTVLDYAGFCDVSSHLCRQQGFFMVTVPHVDSLTELTLVAQCLTKLDPTFTFNGEGWYADCLNAVKGHWDGQKYTDQ